MPRPSKPDAYSHDLFGQPIPAPAAFRKDGAPRKIGYADRPGSGPKKQRCGTCLHPQRILHEGVVSFKCELMTHVWDHSANTDIQLRAPACSRWVRKPFAFPKIQ